MQRQGSQLLLEILDIVVLENYLLRARVTDTLDHGGVVETVGENHTVGEFATKGSQCRVVGDVARAENKRSILSMELRDGVLEFDSMLVVTRDISCATGTGAVLIEGVVHGLEHMLVAAHAEVVVGAPDCDLLLLGGHVGTGELLGQTVDVIEVAVRLVLVLLLQLVLVELLIVELGAMVARNSASGRRRVRSGGSRRLQRGMGRKADCSKG